MVDPVNYQSRDLSRVDGDVAYARETVGKFIAALDQCGGVRGGLKLLELGPGSDFGAQLLLASMGVDVTVADRYLARWDPNFHPILYQTLYDGWDGPKSELAKALENGGYDGTRLTLLEEAAENLSSVPDAAFDVIYSNAVLEHITDLGRVASEAARVVKAGGYGYHKIDWRYHRDFDRPIDHLVMKENIFLIAAEDALWEFGNRFRSIEFWNHFEAVGFRILEREVTDRATPDYVRAVTPALRASISSYREWPEVDLDKVSGVMFMTKLDGAAAALVKERAVDTLGLIAAVKRASLASGRALGRLAERDRRDDARDFVIDPALAKHDGLMWSVQIPGLPIGDRVGDGYGSQSQLFEDGDELGPAHSLHEHIRTRGQGRFSHWNDSVLFSTSDNSSPLGNGRRYVLRVAGRES